MPARSPFYSLPGQATKFEAPPTSAYSLQAERENPGDRVARPTAVLAASYTESAQAADLSIRRAKTMDLSGQGVGGQFS